MIVKFMCISKVILLCTILSSFGAYSPIIYFVSSLWHFKCLNIFFIYHGCKPLFTFLIFMAVGSCYLAWCAPPAP